MSRRHARSEPWTSPASTMCKSSPCLEEWSRLPPSPRSGSSPSSTSAASVFGSSALADDDCSLMVSIGGRRRDITGDVTTHSVSNDEERFVHEKGVLVHLATPPDVSLDADPITHFFSLTLRHPFGWLLSRRRCAPPSGNARDRPDVASFPHLQHRLSDLDPITA